MFHSNCASVFLLLLCLELGDWKYRTGKCGTSLRWVWPCEKPVVIWLLPVVVGVNCLPRISTGTHGSAFAFASITTSWTYISSGASRITEVTFRMVPSHRYITSYCLCSYPAQTTFCALMTRDPIGNWAVLRWIYGTARACFSEFFHDTSDSWRLIDAGSCGTRRFQEHCSGV